MTRILSMYIKSPALIYFLNSDLYLPILSVAQSVKITKFCFYEFLFFFLILPIGNNIIRYFSSSVWLIPGSIIPTTFICKHSFAKEEIFLNLTKSI